MNKNKERRKRIAKETLDIYAPLASRIGMHEIREELEDLAFSETEPEIRSILLERIKVSKRQEKSSSRPPQDAGCGAWPSDTK